MQSENPERGVAPTNFVTTGFNPSLLRSATGKKPERCIPPTSFVTTGFNPSLPRNAAGKNPERGVAPASFVTTGFNPLQKRKKTLRAVGSTHILSKQTHRYE